MNDLTVWLSVAAAIGSGLIGGAFYAFSSFIMASLARLPAGEGIRAMQSINIVVINPWFMVPLFGTALLALALGVMALLDLSEPDAPWLLAGGLLYLVGTIGVTIAFNVPRNNILADTQPEGAEAPEVWARYVSEWTRWNTVRTVTALAASAAFIIALILG